MRTLLIALIPVALLTAFGLGVLFWAAISQLRFSSYFRGRERRPPALGVAGWLAFYRRTLTGAYRLLWWAFRAAFQSGLRRPKGTVTGRPVLCIHGLFLNSTSMWGIRRRLERLGRPTRAVFMGVPFPTPLAYAGPLARVMREMAGLSPADGFDVVAHSIGGIMTREVLRRYPHLATHVHRIVTLGSPHHGTAAVRWMKFGPIYEMLRLDSDYLRRLPTFRALAPHTVALTVATQHDLVVYPVDTAHLEGARPLTLTRVSHLGLMTDPRALDEIAKAFS